MNLKFILEIKLTGFSRHGCGIEGNCGNKFGSKVSYLGPLCGYE